MLRHRCIKAVLLVGFVIAIFYSPAFATSKESSFDDLLEEAETITIVIASKSAQRQEEAPSIVSVITRQEIEAWGARDIADILRLVPGFEFGIDVQSLYGLGFRGIWAHEGKALIMVDGMTVNCFGFGNGNYFGTLPADMIDRVEIIRGPGSALYGGFAEIAAVNIITQKGKALSGATVRGSVGKVGEDWLRAANLSFGISQGDDMELAANIGYTFHPMSNQTYTAFSGAELEMGAESSWREWTHAVISARLKSLEIHYNRNLTTFLAQDVFGEPIPPVGAINTNRLHNYVETLNLKHQYAPNEKTRLETTVEVSRGNPISTAVLAIGYIDPDTGEMSYPDPADLWQNSGATGTRYQGELSAYYKVSDRADLIIGSGYQRNYIESVMATGEPGLRISADPTDLTDKTYSDATYAYGQYTQRMGKLGLTVGSRYENTTFGDAIAPRFGLTYLQNRFNLKLLYGRAFRVPMPWQTYSRQFAVEKVLSKGGMKPEISNTIELEVGYRLTPHIQGKINAFFINVDDPITYIGADNSYQNYGRIQSQGVEGEVRGQFNANLNAFVNFGYTTPGSETSPDFMTGDEKNFLALPPLKINAGAAWSKEKFTISPTLTYLSERYGQSEAEPATVGQNSSYDALLLVNVNLSVTDVMPNVDFHLAVHNLLDEDYTAIQPYYGGHAPFPAQDRQITVGATYRLK